MSQVLDLCLYLILLWIHFDAYVEERRLLGEVARDRAQLQETLAFLSKQMNLLDKKVPSLPYGLQSEVPYIISSSHNIWSTK